MTSHTFRTSTVVSLVAAAVLLTLSVALQPSFGSGSRLASIDAAGWRAGVSAVAFVLGQLPFALAVVGVGRMLHLGAPRLGRIGGFLGVLGAFGHTVFGGISMVLLLMAGDPAHRTVFDHLVSSMNSSPVMIFSMLGLVGTVLGLLLLSIGLFRAHVGARWVGPAIWVFLVVEFVGGSLSNRASYVSSVVLLLAFGELAREASRTWDAYGSVGSTDQSAGYSERAVA